MVITDQISLGYFPRYQTGADIVLIDHGHFDSQVMKRATGPKGAKNV